MKYRLNLFDSSGYKNQKKNLEIEIKPIQENQEQIIEKKQIEELQFYYEYSENSVVNKLWEKSKNKKIKSEINRKQDNSNISKKISKIHKESRNNIIEQKKISNITKISKKEVKFTYTTKIVENPKKNNTESI